MSRIASYRFGSIRHACNGDLAPRSAVLRQWMASQGYKTDGEEEDYYPQTPPEEVPDPPGVFATVGAMGAGAGGAVVIAALGVYAVFKMAFWVAGETGRTLHPDRRQAETVASSSTEKDINATKSGPATPLEPRYAAWWEDSYCFKPMGHRKQAVQERQNVLYGGREGLFQFNNVATVSTRTADGVDFTIKGVQTGGDLSTDLKAAYENASYRVVTTLAQKTGKLGLSVSKKEVAPGMTLGLSGTLPDIDSAKLALDYVHEHVTLKSTSSLSAAPKVDASLTSRFNVKGRDVIGGADVSYDASKGAITKWVLGFGYTAADYQVASMIDDKNDVTALIAHAVRPDLTVGAEVKRNLDSGETALAAAVQHRLASGALQKIKVAHTGEVSVLHEQVLEGKSKIALSGMFDAKDLSKAPKYGVGVDFKY